MLMPNKQGHTTILDGVNALKNVVSAIGSVQGVEPDIIPWGAVREGLSEEVMFQLRPEWIRTLPCEVLGQNFVVELPCEG